MAKFVLIDPSVTDLAGHYHEYAFRVLEAASDHGFETSLATNRRFNRVELPAVQVFPVYRYAYFEPRAPYLLRRAAKQAASRLVGWASRTKHSLEGGQCPSYDSYVRYAWRRTQLFCKRRAFVADSLRLFRQISLAEGDLVFMPTAAAADVLGLADLIRSHLDATKATWHLLFRREIDDTLRRGLERFGSRLSQQGVHFYTDTEPLTAQYNRLGVAEFRTLPIPVEGFRHPEGTRGSGFRSELPWSAAIHRRFLSSRSDLPCRQFAKTEGGCATIPSGDKSPHTKVHVVYLGDARTEKGYHWLPRLVRDAMAANLPVRFTIQSNFNVPSGEPAAARARQELESLARDAPITLLLQPLNSEQYRRLLFDADVVLLPYDREAYRSRSSGVFAEALAAGKPLIVPKGTWMAGELAGAADNIGATYSDAGDLFHQLVELVRHNQRYRAAANTFAASWSNRHSPRKLIELLHRPAGLSLEANLI